MLPPNRKWFAVLGVAISLQIVQPVRADDGHERLATTEERAILARLDELQRKAVASPDLVLRALYSIGGLDEQAGGTMRIHEEVATVALLEAARGSTDPVVLDILLWRCSFHPTTQCDRIDLATRWTQTDTQNQVAWLTLASVRKEQGDLDGARAAFLRASRASLWRDHYGDVLRRSVGALPSDLSASERAAALQVVFGRASAMSFTALQTLSIMCREPDEMRTACARIVDTAARDADTLLVLNLTVPLSVRAGVHPTIVARYQQTADAIQWAVLQTTPTIDEAMDGTVMADSPQLRQALRQIDVRLAIGERGEADRFLLDRHLSQADAAKRYVASLSPEAFLAHEDRRAGASIAPRARAVNADSAHSTAASP